MTKEIWKPIEGYEGYYEVSNFSRARSVDRSVIGKNGVTYTKSGMILKCNSRVNGYPMVRCVRNNKVRLLYLHRVLATAFIPNPQHKPFIDHIDGDRGNCIISNLRWCTQKENINNPISIMNRTGENNGKSRRVHQLSLTTNKILNTFSCLAEACRKLGVNSGHISSCCRGSRKTAGGFKWEYAHE